MNANNVEVRERPILYRAPMVRAVLDGTKTQTRRIVKGPKQAYPKDHWDIIAGRYVCWPGDEAESYPLVCPYGKPGDRLWVRETHAAYLLGIENGTRYYARVLYKADEYKQEFDISAEVYRKLDDAEARGDWTPSIFMPRWASRITLEIVSIRVERLKDISAADAIAEGIEIDQGWEEEPSFGYKDYSGDDESYPFTDPVDSFRSLWRSINGSGSWDANPFVWVIEFKRVDQVASARSVA